LNSKPKNWHKFKKILGLAHQSDGFNTFSQRRWLAIFHVLSFIGKIKVESKWSILQVFEDEFDVLISMHSRRPLVNTTLLLFDVALNSCIKFADEVLIP